jgi:hypothetical protein
MGTAHSGKPAVTARDTVGEACAAMSENFRTERRMCCRIRLEGHATLRQPGANRAPQVVDANPGQLYSRKRSLKRAAKSGHVLADCRNPWVAAYRPSPS